MASTNIKSVSNGVVWTQTGNGVPDHIAVKGTSYIDLDTVTEYLNEDGLGLWKLNSGGGGPTTDIYISGMTFDTSDYDLILNRNDGVNFTQNLGILASDMNVTGGTYNQSTGTATFTNNSGGTFQVTGFLTGMTGFISGSGVNNQIAFWNGSDSQTGSSGLTWNGTYLSTTKSTKPTPIGFNMNHYSHDGSVDVSFFGGNYFNNSGSLGRNNNAFTAWRFQGNSSSNNAFGGVAMTMANTTGVDNTIYNVSMNASGNGFVTTYPNQRFIINSDTDNGIDSLQVNGSAFANSFKKSGGTSSQFLKADGSVDGTTYASVTYVDSKVQDVIVDGVTDFAPSQNIVYDKLLVKQNLPTGFISGLALTIKPSDNTKAIIGNGVYAITDFTVLSAVTVQLITVTTPIEFTPQFLLTNTASYIALDINKNVIQSSSPFTNADRRTLALIGATIHTNNVNINVVNEIKAPIVAPTNQLHDLIKAVGSLNLSGNIYSPNGANLQLNKSEGVIWGLGINASNFYNPHELVLSGQSGFTFNYRLRTGTQFPNTTNIDPENYDNGGVLTSVPNNRYTIQRINLFQSGLSRIQYGQNIYQTLEDARVNLTTENFVTEQNISDNAIFRAYLIIKKGVTNLTLAISNGDAYFISVDKFGNIVGGGSLATLQSVYDNSITPEIVTNSTLGPLSIRNGGGTADNTTRIFEGLSSGGTVTSNITASGIFSGTSFIKSGGTTTQALLADGSVLNNPLRGVGVDGRVAKFTGTTALTQSIIADDGNKVVFYGTAGVGSTDSVFETYTTTGVLRTKISGSGAQTWNLNSGSAEVGLIAYSTPNGSPGIVLNNLAGNRRSDIRLHSQTDGGIAFIASAISGSTGVPQMLLGTNGNFMIGTATNNNVDKLQVNGSIQATQFKLSALNTEPATSTSTGVLGEIRIVNGFIYVCVATNVWQRAALSTF